MRAEPQLGALLEKTANLKGAADDRVLVSSTGSSGKYFNEELTGRLFKEFTHSLEKPTARI